ncbi:MAG TPA: NUDIX domain-containing protein [Nitrososphaerales archaeon]|nr:NUDIX domain-containing protein [Nitrososphaerales archaeon]
MEERSAGAVLFHQDSGSRRYLLLFNGGHWDFPKGNIETGERELETVLREVREETGLAGITLIDGFRKEIEYFYRRGEMTVHKKVVFFLARTDEDRVKISSEHQAFGWFRYEQALGKTTHENSKHLLNEAEGMLRTREGAAAGA